MEPAVVAAIELAVGADREAIGAAAGGRDDLLAAAGPAAGDASLLDLDHDDAAVVHHDRRLGKAQSVGDQFELHPRLPCSCSFAVLSRPRSEEHTSELQSLMRISYAVFCLKKKNKH